MNTIILATDFSKESESASEFALGIAKIFKCRLIILHVYKIAYHTPNWADTFDPEANKNKVKSMRKLYRLRNRLRKLSDEPIEIMLSARGGETIDTIKTVISEQHADILVMGTSGEKSPRYTYFGSQATELILQTTVPLLLVPPHAHFSQFKTIVLALDLQHTVDAGALDNVIRFCKESGAVLNMVCISDDPTDLKVVETGQHIRNLMLAIPHTMSIIPGHNANSKILDFANDNHADLLIMLPKAHNRLLYTVLESNTQQIARQSNIPVMAAV